MRPIALLGLVIALAACESTPSRGMFTPAAPTTARAPSASAPSGTGTSTGGFDFAGEDRDDEADADAEAKVAAEGDVDPIELAARAQGLDPSQLSKPEPKPEPAAVAPTAAAAMPGIPMPQWAPDQPIDGSWGLRVIATLHDVQPPRAVIATADGKELVVQPGQMLPEQRMVVLAIGHGAVQVAKVTPQGFYARVDTETVATLAPSQTQ